MIPCLGLGAVGTTTFDQTWRLGSLSPLTSPKLENQLFQAGALLKGEEARWDGLEDHLFGLLFFKRLCDLWEEDSQKQSQADDSSSEEQVHLRPVVPAEHHWTEVLQLDSNRGKALNRALQALESANPVLAGSFTGLDFSHSDHLPDSKLVAVLQHFDALSLRNRDISPAVLAATAEAAFAQLQNIHGLQGPRPLSLQRLQELWPSAPKERTGMVEFLQELGYVNTEENVED